MQTNQTEIRNLQQADFNAELSKMIDAKTLALSAPEKKRGLIESLMDAFHSSTIEMDANIGHLLTSLTLKGVQGMVDLGAIIFTIDEFKTDIRDSLLYSVFGIDIRDETKASDYLNQISAALTAWDQDSLILRKNTLNAAMLIQFGEASTLDEAKTVLRETNQLIESYDQLRAQYPGETWLLDQTTTWAPSIMSMMPTITKMAWKQVFSTKTYRDLAKDFGDSVSTRINFLKSKEAKEVYLQSLSDAWTEMFKHRDGKYFDYTKAKEDIVKVADGLADQALLDAKTLALKVGMDYGWASKMSTLLKHVKASDISFNDFDQSIELVVVSRHTDEFSLSKINDGHIPKFSKVKTNTMGLEDYFLNPALYNKLVQNKGIKGADTLGLEEFSKYENNLKGIVPGYQPTEVTDEMAKAYMEVFNLKKQREALSENIPIDSLLGSVAEAKTALLLKAENQLGYLHKFLEDRAKAQMELAQQNMSVDRMKEILATLPGSKDALLIKTAHTKIDEMGRMYGDPEIFGYTDSGTVRFVSGDKDVHDLLAYKPDGTRVELTPEQRIAVFAEARAQGLVEHGSTIDWGKVSSDIKTNESYLQNSLEGEIELKEKLINKAQKEGMLVGLSENGEIFNISGKFNGTALTQETMGLFLTWNTWLTDGDDRVVQAALAESAQSPSGSGINGSGTDTGAPPKRFHVPFNMGETGSKQFAGIKFDGSVEFWGRTDHPPSQEVLAQLDGTINAQQIYASIAAFAALRVDGSVVTWGSPYAGGDSSGVAEKLNGTVKTLKIFSNGYSVQGYGYTAAFAALREDGSVVTWGDKYGGEKIIFERDYPNMGFIQYADVSDHLNGGVRVVDIVSNDQSFSALREDGSVISWGTSTTGGKQSFAYKYYETFYELPIDHLLDGSVKVVQLFSTRNSFAALREDGMFVVWGSSPWLMDDPEYKGMSSKERFDQYLGIINSTKNFDIENVLVTEDGFVLVDANNQYMSFSSIFNSLENQYKTTPAYGKKIIQINRGPYSVDYLHDDGTIFSVGGYYGDNSGLGGELRQDIREGMTNIHAKQIFNNGGATAAILEDGSVYAWGDTRAGSLLGSAAEHLNGEIDVVKILETKRWQFFALREDGSVVAWGRDIGAKIIPATSDKIIDLIDGHYTIYAVTQSGSVIYLEGFGYSPDPSDKFFSISNPDTDVNFYEDVGSSEPEVGIALSAADVAEGNSGEKTMVFTVTLDKAYDHEVFASYVTRQAESTASSGLDYKTSVGVVTFAAGQTTAQVAVPVIGDTSFEPDETVTLLLTNIQGGKLPNNAASLAVSAKILNDDAKQVPSISIGNSFRTEGDADGLGYQIGSVKLYADRASDTDKTIHFVVKDGSANYGADYSVIGVGLDSKGSVVLKAGETSANIEYWVKGDAVPELTEYFKLEIIQDSTSSYSLATPGFSIVKIFDNDHHLDGDVPRLLSSVVRNSRLELNYSEQLSSLLPSAAQFAVMVNGEKVPVVSVEIQDSKLSLQLAKTIFESDKVLLNYFSDSTSGLFAVQDVAGNNANPESNLAVPVVAGSLAPVPVQGTAGNDVLSVPANAAFSNIFTAGGDDVVMGGGGLDTIVLPVTWQEILALGGVTRDPAGQLHIPTPLGNVKATHTERLQTSDGTLLATDLRLPVYGVDDGDATGQVLSLVYWGTGALPEAVLLKHWVGIAEQLDDIGKLSQAILDAVAPSLASQVLVSHLFQQVAGRPGTAAEVQGLVDLIGDGRMFPTQGDFYAAAAGLVPVPAELIGVVQVLDAGATL